MSILTWRVTNRQAFFIPIAVLFIMIGLIEWQVLSYTSGTFSYPIDNSFISMTTARNIAMYGRWGLTPGTFVSATSSVLYPAILALCYKLFGVHLLIPFVINLATSSLFILFLQQWLIRNKVSPMHQLIIQLAAIFLIPLPVIVMIGMEHSLQILFGFIFIDLVSGKLSKGLQISWRECLCAALLTATRYEGIFIALIAVILLLYKRRWIQALILLLCAATPVVLFGIYSLNKDNFFLSITAVQKSNFLPGNLEDCWKFLKKDFFERLFFQPTTLGTAVLQRLLVILPLTYILFRRILTGNPLYRYYLYIVTGSLLLHLSFANSLFFYRYESYLVALSIPVVGAILSKTATDLNIIPRSAWWMPAFAAIILVFPLGWRSKTAMQDIPLATTNMYAQYFQLGRFIHTYYDRDRVAVNTIGAVSYLSSGNAVDLSGAGNMEIASAIKYNMYTWQYMSYVLKREGVKIIAISDRSLSPTLTNEWTKVASWDLEIIVPPGDKDLSFYAVHAADAKALKANLSAYQAFLPPGVKVTYFFKD